MPVAIEARILLCRISRCCMRIMTCLILTTTLATTLPRPVAAGDKAGVKLPDAIEVATRPLKLNGMGLREATFLNIDVYVAGLYLETASSDPVAILQSTQVKRLVIRFVRDVDRGDI